MSTAPPERRPQQPLHKPSTQMVTYTLDRTQVWRQYGWIDHLGRMYDLAEDPRKYEVASYCPLWVLSDNEPPVIPEELP